VRIAGEWRKLGIEPRELYTHADGLLFHLAGKLGTVPGSGEHYFRVDDPRRPEYVQKLDLLAPLPGSAHTPQHRVVKGLLSAGARLLAV
jgi:hypothetical protein